MRRSFVLLGCLATTAVNAQIPVGGLVPNGTVWTRGSTHVVQDNVEIAGLTVEPGVRVEFEGFFRFEVKGILTATGTAEEPIVFTNAPGNDGWNGILFNFSPPGSELDYCVIQDSGGVGIRLEQSTVVARNCVFERGARGIRLLNDSFITLEDCHIRNNRATFHGAGIHANDSTVMMIRCSVTDNSASAAGTLLGGGIYVNPGVLDLTDCYVRNNRLTGSTFVSDVQGGGIYCAGTLKMLRCTVADNAIRTPDSGSTHGGTVAFDAHGGGIRARGTIEVQNSWIRGNTVRTGNVRNDSCCSGFASTNTSGGGLFASGETRLINSIVSHNTLTGGSNFGGRSGRFIAGNGVYVSSGTVEFENVTIAHNGGHGTCLHRNDGTVTVVNSILYFNAGPEISGAVTATYSNIQEGFDGEGNIDVNPLFASADDLRIVSGSPCIHAGNPAPEFNDGPCIVARGGAFADPRNDMGAHGGSGACLGEPFLPDCNFNSRDDAKDIASGESHDCNGNGLPDECDIRESRSPDINGDGVPDECQRFSVHLEPAGELCWDLVLTSQDSLYGGEVAVAHDSTVLELPAVTLGSDLAGRVDPDTGFLVDRTVGAARCGANTQGLSIGWLINPDPAAGQPPLPPGTHHVFRLCYNVRNGAPPGKCSPIRFVDCLGTAEAPFLNVVTPDSGQSTLLFTRNAKFCPDIFRRGDANGDGRFDISDPLAILLWLFRGASSPGCRDAADADDNGDANVTDAVFLINWRFLDGPPPMAPFPACDRDPTADTLTTCDYQSCN